MTIPAFYIANRFGIPRLQSTSVSVSATAVTYDFRNAGAGNFAGLILVNLAQAIPDGTTATLPVKFGNVQLTRLDNADVTVADLQGTGIYLAYYDSTTGLLQLLTGLNAPAAAAATA